MRKLKRVTTLWIWIVIGLLVLASSPFDAYADSMDKAVDYPGKKEFTCFNFMILLPDLRIKLRLTCFLSVAMLVITVFCGDRVFIGSMGVFILLT